MTRIFINYRREETAGDAQALYDRLQRRFGAPNVFFDRASLTGGMKWLEVIQAHGTSASVFVSLIGPRWLEIMEERDARGEGSDMVGLELELALKSDSGAYVLPVLIDGARMPDKTRLSSSLEPLAGWQAESLRHDRWDDDVAHLIKVLEDIVERSPPTAPGQPGTDSSLVPIDGGHAGTVDARHLAEVVRFLRQGNVVVFLGPGANASGREQEWEPGCGQLPDARELAHGLALTGELDAEIASEATDLARVSQYLAVTAGPADLYNALRDFLSVDCEPTPVHRFLVSLPATLRRLGFPKPHQLIVTTNYDLALERAFEQAGEEYDLVVYMASGEDRGRFLHVPHGAEPTTIADPNGYIDLPFTEGQTLTRTVIVKIHGAVERPRRYPWRENYVITEDDYIDYLSQRRIEDIVPFDVLDKLRGSHYLFLGYTMRDWNLRVFLQRLWGDQKLKAKSWAIQPAPDSLEKDFWDAFDVDLFAAPLSTYVGALDDQLAASTPAGA